MKRKYILCVRNENEFIVWAKNGKRKKINSFFHAGAWAQGFYLEPLHQSNFFVIGFFKIGSHELFAWAVSKL
jgi:hypothetical protein